MKPIYALKDRAIDGFADPFAQPSEQHAIRWLQDIVNDEGNGGMINKHPDDFDLYQVGTWDSDKAAILHCTPRLVARAKDLVKREE